jgi:LacI family transcriptional regulator
MKKILLLIDYSSDFDRKLLRGLIHYGHEKGSWFFYRMPSYYVAMHGSRGVLEWARKWGASAIVGKWTDDSVNLQQELNIPVVVQNYHHRSIDSSNLTGDYIGTGRMAAEFFGNRLFRNFAFFGQHGIIWSDERSKGYAREVARMGGNLFSLELEQQAKEEQREQITAWLRDLPKPTALFCCDDAHALFIAETCKMADIHIPDEIALLGVDNDDLICNISDPPISSIELDVESGGYLMGKLIDRQFNHEYTGNFNIVIKPVRIELRQSTESFAICDEHILKVVRHIHAHYSTDLTIDELLRQVPLSRRNLEVKFKHIMGNTIYQYILNHRCDRLARLLITTDRTPRELCTEVGFKDYNNVARIFKRYMNCTPTEYRLRERHDVF